MGDPRKRRKKYSTPAHPWQKGRIEEEKELITTYGVRNKREIYKMNSMLKGFADDAKKLVALRTKQAEKEKQQMLNKLQSLGLLAATAQLADVLGLELKDTMERRLQTLVYSTGMAKSIKQARQFITHRHITVGGKIITQPSYLVTKKEEEQINFSASSTLSSPEHPERKVEEKEEVEKKKPKKKKAERKPRKESKKAEKKKPRKEKKKPKKEAKEKKEPKEEKSEEK